MPCNCRSLGLSLHLSKEDEESTTTSTGAAITAHPDAEKHPVSLDPWCSGCSSPYLKFYSAHKHEYTAICTIVCGSLKDTATGYKAHVH